MNGNAKQLIAVPPANVTGRDVPVLFVSGVRLLYRDPQCRSNTNVEALQTNLWDPVETVSSIFARPPVCVLTISEGEDVGGRQHISLPRLTGGLALGTLGPSRT